MAIPLIVILIPIGVSIGSLKLVNWLIKKGKVFRIFSLIYSLIVGGLLILAGFLILTQAGYIITSFATMLCGLVLVITGGFRSLFVSKQKIVQSEIEDKIAEERTKEEEAQYSSYDWICQESKKILEAGKIEDKMKFHKLLEILDSNRKYPEFKMLSKQLRDLESKEYAEIMQKINRNR